MNDGLKDLLAIIIAIMVGFSAGYYACTRELQPTIQQLTTENQQLATNLGEIRPTLDGAVARSVVAERGLTEAVELVGTIQDRNKRITVLVETIRATVKQLRGIIEEGERVKEFLGDYSEN